MDVQQLVDRLSPFVKRNYLPLALGFFGLIFLAYGLIVLVGSFSSSNDIVFESEAKDSQVQSQEKEIFVDVEGYVVKPGVYKLLSNSRVQDALVAAGGLAGSADRDWVAKNLNLALRLKDGVKIYIPGAGETVGKSSAGSIGSTSSMGISSGVEAGGQININTASEQELDTLSGIGPVTAQKIIDGRPYSTIEDLTAKKIVSQSVFEKIKEKITIY